MGTSSNASRPLDQAKQGLDERETMKNTVFRDPAVKEYDNIAIADTDTPPAKLNQEDPKMRAYGSKRTFGGCRTQRRGGGKIHVTIFVKNRRRVRYLVRRVLRNNPELCQKRIKGSRNMFETIVPPAKKIRREEANIRIIQIESMLHLLMRDCDVSGMKEAANAIDVIVSNYTDAVYIAIAEKDQ